MIPVSNSGVPSASHWNRKSSLGMSGALARTPPRPSPYPQGETETRLIIPVNALVWEVTGHIRGPTQMRSQKSYRPVSPLSKALEGSLWASSRSWAFSGDLSGSGLCKSPHSRPYPCPAQPGRALTHGHVIGQPVFGD